MHTPCGIHDELLSKATFEACFAELSEELRVLLRAFASELQMAGQQPQELLDRETRHLSSSAEDVLLQVDNLRDLWRIAQGRPQTHREPADVLDSVTEAVEKSRDVAEPRGIDVSYQLRDRLPVLVSPRRLTRMLCSVLLGLIDRSHRGGRVEVIVRRSGRHLAVRFLADAMDGRPDKHSGLLDWSVPPSGSLEKLSKQLRLPLARALAQWHGGNLWSERREAGAGSDLVMRLPTVSPSALVGSSLVKDTGAVRDCAGREVLVVDDNVDSARTIAAFLQLSGHMVHTRYDGLAALDAAESQRPEVIILDLGLPKLDGFQVAERVRKHAQLRHVKLIAVSGYGHDEALERSRRVGFDHHLVKPVDNQELLSLVERE